DTERDPVEELRGRERRAHLARGTLRGARRTTCQQDEPAHRLRPRRGVGRGALDEVFKGLVLVVVAVGPGEVARNVLGDVAEDLAELDVVDERVRTLALD